MEGTKSEDKISNFPSPNSRQASNHFGQDALVRESIPSGPD